MLLGGGILWLNPFLLNNVINWVQIFLKGTNNFAGKIGFILLIKQKKNNNKTKEAPPEASEDGQKCETKPQYKNMETESHQTRRALIMKETSSLWPTEPKKPDPDNRNTVEALPKVKAKKIDIYSEWKLGPSWCVILACQIMMLKIFVYCVYKMEWQLKICLPKQTALLLFHTSQALS